MQSKNKKLVTVIVPAYNEEKTLDKCLSSIKEQTYSPIELIVIDDGSKDLTPVIAEKYADVFIEQKHQGPGVARNLASKKAKGEILVFIDADMYLDKDYIKNITLPLVRGLAKSAYTKDEYVVNNNNIWVKCYLFDNNIKGDLKNIENKNQSSYFRAILKEYFLKVGGFDFQMGYNDDKLKNLNIKSFLAKNAKSYHYNPETLLDIFISSRWIGRSPKYKKTIKNILKYSTLNSLVISFKKIRKGAPLVFVFYKVIFDTGILAGTLFKNPKTNYSK